MATHDDPDLERWVDTRMTALDPDRTGEPETEGALAQLRVRATATPYRPVHVWSMAAGAAALLVAVLEPWVGCRRTGPVTSPTSGHARPRAETSPATTLSHRRHTSGRRDRPTGRSAPG